MISKSRVLISLVGAAALTMVGIASASAAPGGGSNGTCSGGDVSGLYRNLTITGECTVPDGATLTVTGNLTVAPGASFDAMTDSQVTIGGNVVAGAGSSFGLGCTTAHPCDNGNPPAGEGEFTSTSDVVGGNVILNGVFNAALNGDHIYGNVVSSGGGAGTDFPGFVPFSVKDNTIDGNLVVSDLSTIWFGVIRDHIGGNVVLTNIQLGDPDGNEVVTNVIGKNLICQGNSPANQVGDSGGQSNEVGGKAIGQCAMINAG